jgi:DNA-binding response OmpR family regulator
MGNSRGQHILVLSDDFLSLSTLKEHFEERGYWVTTANGWGQAHLALGSSNIVDLMIIDQSNSGCDGIDFLRTISNAEAFQQPRVIVSSHAGQLPQTAQDLIKAYVTKPYSLSMMDAMVNLILSSSTPIPTSENEILSGDDVHEAPLASDKDPEHFSLQSTASPAKLPQDK